MTPYPTEIPASELDLTERPAPARLLATSARCRAETTVGEPEPTYQKSAARSMQGMD